MRELIAPSPGLASRATHHITFPDYSPGELAEIFRRLATDYDDHLTDAAGRRLGEIMRDLRNPTIQTTRRVPPAAAVVSVVGRAAEAARPTSSLCVC